MQVEVASYLFLVGLFGLKAPSAYILAACNHRIFQSDKRIAKAHQCKKPALMAGFLLFCVNLFLHQFMNVILIISFVIIADIYTFHKNFSIIYFIS